MHYTIMILDSVIDSQKVKLNKNGNQYSITLYNEELNDSTTKTFDELMWMLSMFLKGLREQSEQAVLTTTHENLGLNSKGELICRK